MDTYHNDEDHKSREEIIQKLGKDLVSLHNDSHLFFEQIGVSPFDLEQYLANPDNFPKEVFNYIQARREEIEEMLDKKLKKIEEEHNSENGISKKAPRKKEPVQSHWILMR